MNGFAFQPHPLFRWHLGLLLAGLPRRFIASRFGKILSGGPNQPLSNPIRKADAYRVSRFSNQRVVFRHQPNPERGGMCP